MQPYKNKVRQKPANIGETLKKVPKSSKKDLKRPKNKKKRRKRQKWNKIAEYYAFLLKAKMRTN